VLQIALALGAGQDPHDHREVPHLGNAELRALGPARPAARGAAC
jgi:probable phosphoglycerate mutase